MAAVLPALLSLDKSCDHPRQYRFVSKVSKHSDLRSSCSVAGECDGKELTVRPAHYAETGARPLRSGVVQWCTRVVMRLKKAMQL